MTSNARIDLRHCKLPRFAGDGELAFATQRRSIEKLSELALTIALVCHRRLFGQYYSVLMPEYFQSMPYRSGVFVRPLVTTSRICSHAERPGDIDLLVIPYERDELLLDHALGLEIKAVRASFTKQGKSPNEFGFSQADDLLALGFPYVGVAHLMTSDPGPTSSWVERSVCEVLDEHDRVGEFSEVSCDWLPAFLIDRCHGRQIASCRATEVGLVSAYIEKKDLSDRPSGYWIPSGRRALKNPRSNPQLIDRIGAYFRANSERFHEIPRCPWRTIPEPQKCKSCSPGNISAADIKVLGEVRKIGW